MKRGDIVMLAGGLGKPRPGVVVQADELGDDTTTVLVCPLSSDIQETSRLRPIFEPSATNGLRVRSQVMADKITPARRDRIHEQIGILDEDGRERLDRALLIVLGLAK